MGVFRDAGVRLYYREAGRGTPLVLLHGLGSSSEDWENQIPAFARHFRVIAPDLRGHGASDRSGDYGVERFARDTWALLDHLGVAQPLLLGYSMGGAVAMQMALDRPGRVPRLVLANTLPSFRTDTLAKRWMLWSRLLMMSWVGPRGLAEVMARRLFPRPDQARLREKIARRNAQNDKNVYLQSVRALTRWSVTERLQQLSMPVLVLAAEQDYFEAPATAQFVATLRDSRAITFPGTRHGLPLEQPEAFNAAVLEFLGVALPRAAPAASVPAAMPGS
ncbi:MAG TPA: alpha/beta fold hydrolase [Candidatus Binatia bacterium]|nr:alpha/beta fold hydrolase [Candidatus Binatia bacterium]